MLADMHCHYPMHVIAQEPKRPLPGAPSLTVDAMTEVSQRPGWVEKLRALALRTAASRLNYGDDRWRVSLDELNAGDVRAVFSVLYEPFAEFDLDEPPGAPPERGYFADLIDQIERVEADLFEVDPGRVAHEVIRSGADLDRVSGEGKAAFMHCVEGGFHLGAAIDEIDANVAELSRRGVVYVTLAHLFYRGVAGNAPALPFMKDGTYRAFFHQPRRGLSKLGVAAVEAMYRHRVLIDVSHMNQRALYETFALLEELDRKSGREPTEYPVIATHAGYRFGEQEYMLSPPTICKIAGRGGVIGLILARHQLNERAGVADPDDPNETPLVIRRHIDAIRAATPSGTNAHVAIGSDLDGFIKPTLAGIETAGDLAKLERPLRAAYKGDAEAILSGNAIRVAKAALG
ncbi:MAG TPA: membrane dipeptidase [Solirubrobacterales bacterium]|nr:membrane dipeptidase [Solirubrobacterales bacterium]